MKTFGVCLILHQLASPVLAGQSPTAGFRWGDWSEWEPCVKVGKNHRRRRICFGPIVNKKIDKKNCEYNLGGSNIDVARCTEDDMVSSDGISLGRMENPIKSSQWQAWQEWSKCSGSPAVKKRVRYCGISIRRQVQSNRICKTTSARTGGRSETNKEIIPCGNDDVQGGLSLGGRTTQSQFTQSNRIELSAPECYYPPGSPVEPGIGRIVGGRPSVHGENPHIVMLSYKGFGGYGQFCDGSIIHNRFILTAAHCFVGWDESPTTYEVVVGAYNKVEKSEKQKTYLLEDITCHESYKVSSRQIIYDVCILKTAEDIEFNRYVWPICLPDNLPPPNDGNYNQNCTVAGWGDTRFTGDEKILNEVDVPVLTHETCTDWYEAENILIDKEQHVCAGYEQGGLDACQGDSGGPFVCKRNLAKDKKGGTIKNHTDLKVLTGVVSFGVGCALAKNPGVYTNVHHFLDFIHDIVNEHDACVGTNPCLNSGTCIDTYHGYECECAGNFIGKNCDMNRDDMNACYGNDCSTNSNCVVDENKAEGFRCECHVDYSGDKCRTLDNPCREHDCGSSSNGLCELDGTGAPFCICADGWTGSNCKTDVNECAMGSDDCSADATCHNTDGSYECSCGAGYEGDGRVSGEGCSDTDECFIQSHNCGSQSICVNHDGGFSCECKPGFVGNPPAVRCAKSNEAPRGCARFTNDFATENLMWGDNTPKYHVTCGMDDDRFLSFDQIIAEQDIVHPISTNVRQNGGANSCKIACNPGTIPQYPGYAKNSDGSANVICEAKGKKSVWKPSGKQIRCYGCKPPTGSILSDCTSKGKKYTICTAKCANGNEGEWRTRCSKKKGNYIWDSIAAKVEATCN